MILKQKHVSDSYVPALDRRTLMTTPVSLFAGAYRLMFGCNSRSELTSATLGNAAYAYAFDHIGNRATASEAGTQLAYAANALNQYATITETEAFTPTYDADGNATSVKTATGTWSVSCNGENRPVRFENAGTQTVVECGYDSLGRRFEKKVTVAGTLVLHERYAYRGYLQIAAFDVAGTQTPTLKRVIYWDPTEETATRPLAVNILGDNVYFPTVDLTKNVCELVDFYGNVAATYDYAPFGAVSSGTPSGSAVPANPLQWSSEIYDSELDLVYYNYRHYSPSLGRFLSRDPIEEQGGLNLYAFIQNQSSGRFDLLGTSEPSIDRHIGPAWLRELLGIPDEDLKEWFFKRFPNALEFAKNKMKERLAEKICDAKNANTMPNNTVSWGFGGDDFKKYGDENMGFYEKYLLMGHFSVRTKNITVNWSSGCEFSWSATFYLEDVTGSNMPSLKDLKENTPAFLYDLLIHLSPLLAYIFSPRTVVMGEWEDSGAGCCPNEGKE